MKNTLFCSNKTLQISVKNFQVKASSRADSVLKTAHRILADVMVYRRVPRLSEPCEDAQCQTCSSIYLDKIILAVQKSRPVTFVLPAFPGKSPNSKKVLGHLPDYAEQLSLQFLGDLCAQVKKYYSAGIKIIICSDGRVFSDIVGMKERHVTEYQNELDHLIEKMSLVDVVTFNLDDHYENLNFVQMRAEIMKAYGKSLEFLKNKVRNGATPAANPEEQDANRMYCGITRFLFEDAQSPGQTKSRTLIQKESKVKAYEVIRRSNAWSELIAERFPEAVRLSIHPQTCGASKLGIRLVGNESWMTPWHGVAVETKKGHVLLKRSEAEDLGAQLVNFSDGRPSHYSLVKGQCSEMVGA